MESNMEKWFDKNGMINTKPYKGDDDVNDILFTSTYLLLLEELDEDAHIYTWDIQSNRDSHDNRTGYTAFLQRMGLKYTKPVYELLKGRKWFHPRDLAFYGANKYPFLEPFLLPIVDVANLISCATTWKTNKDGKHITTSGKMLALTRMLAFKRYRVLKICTALIKKNKYFRSWSNVSTIYFSADHPTTKAIIRMEKRGLL